jgi:hypothetical protein
MIAKLQVGHDYAVTGAGKWSEYKQDVRVIAITTMEQAEFQEFGIYDTWFAEYEVPETLYQQALLENGPVYHCKVIESRDPEVINEGQTDVYLFPMMLSYPNTTELVACKAYNWKITTRPYKETDRFNPLTKLPVDMTSLLTQALKPYIFDAVTAYENEDDIIVSQAEYDAFTKEREAEELNQTAKTDTSDSEIQDQLARMYAVVEATKAKEEKLRLTQLAADDYLRNASLKYNENSLLSQQLTARDNALRLKYNALSVIVDQVNQNLPPEDRIVLPPYEELGT